MSNIGTSTFASVYTALPDARCQIRAGADVITRALTSGRLGTRQDSDHGAFDGVGMNLRIEATSEDPRNPLTIGRVIEVKHVEADGWVKMRIAARKAQAGIVLLAMEHPGE